MLHAAGSEFGLPSAVTGPHGRWASLIRPVAGSEIARFQQHLLRLSADCRRSRFGNATSDAFVRDYGRQINHRNTLLLGLFNAGELRAAANFDRFKQLAYRSQLHSLSTALAVARMHRAYGRNRPPCPRFGNRAHISQLSRAQSADATCRRKDGSEIALRGRRMLRPPARAL